MFEIATQFNAIFRAQQQQQSNSHPNNVSVSLLSMWTSRRVHAFLNILSSQLNLMEDSASLRDALDACVFFSGSMGRLGADFTAQLPPLFENRMVAIVVHIWRDGTGQLAETLRICRDAGVAAPLVSSTVVTGEIGVDGGGGGGDGPSSSSSSSSSSSVIMAPPRQLMGLPPLGRLVNACLTGLNELRRCLLPGIFPRLRQALEQELLLQVKNILHSHERAVMTPGLRGEAVQLREVAKEMKEMTKNIIFPYCRGALELSLGNEAGAKEQFDKLRKFLEPPPPPPPLPPVEEAPTAEQAPMAEQGEGEEPVVTETGTSDVVDEA